MRSDCTVMFWGRRRQWWLLMLIAIVQAPVAVIGFVPVVDPLPHVVAVAAAVTLAGLSLLYARRADPRGSVVAVARPSSSP